MRKPNRKPDSGDGENLLSKQRFKFWKYTVTYHTRISQTFIFHSYSLKSGKQKAYTHLESLLKPDDVGCFTIYETNGHISYKAEDKVFQDPYVTTGTLFAMKEKKGTFLFSFAYSKDFEPIKQGISTYSVFSRLLSNAKILGYSVVYEPVDTGTYRISLFHGKSNHRATMRISDHGDAQCIEDYDVSPSGITYFHMYKILESKAMTTTTREKKKAKRIISLKEYCMGYSEGLRCLESNTVTTMSEWIMEKKTDPAMSRSFLAGFQNGFDKAKSSS